MDSPTIKLSVKRPLLKRDIPKKVSFNPSDYEFKISKFFGITENQVDDVIQNLSKKHIIKEALIGDSLIKYHTLKFLMKKYPDEEVNFIHGLSSLFTRNKTMAEYCNNFFFNDIKITHLKLNEHSKGTIFEAIYHISYKENRKIYEKLQDLYSYLINIEGNDIEEIKRLIKSENKDEKDDLKSSKLYNNQEIVEDKTWFIYFQNNLEMKGKEIKKAFYHKKYEGKINYKNKS